MNIIAVVGSAPCAQEDLTELRRLCGSFTVCVLNRAVKLQIAFDYFLTGHPEIFFADMTVAREGGAEFVAIGADRHEGYDETYRPTGRLAWGGSAANAICYFVPRGLRVVLCGCPFDRSGHFNDPDGNYHADELWNWFLLGHPHRTAFNSSVRSMSGNTKDLFGYPTKEWLNESC